MSTISYGPPRVDPAIQPLGLRTTGTQTFTPNQDRIDNNQPAHVILASMYTAIINAITRGEVGHWQTRLQGVWQPWLPNNYNMYFFLEAGVNCVVLNASTFGIELQTRIYNNGYQIRFHYATPPAMLLTRFHQRLLDFMKRILHASLYSIFYGVGLPNDANGVYGRIQPGSTWLDASIHVPGWMRPYTPFASFGSQNASTKSFFFFFL
jgi:hypothetical protein